MYNIFLYFEDSICSTVGYVAHALTGSDEQGCDYLKEHVSEDCAVAKKIKLKKSFSVADYYAKCRLGEGHHLYDDLFVLLGSIRNPLFVATPVKDGEIFYDYSSNEQRFDINYVLSNENGHSVMTDWLVNYSSKNGINIPQLIHDDYFLAIKLTFNAGLYVSAMKLLLSCIDSVAYIEYGHDRKSVPFIKWLDTYADITALGVTASELWELRNGILHMTNLNSTKVRNKKERRISFRVGVSTNDKYEEDGVFYFDFREMIQVVTAAKSNWLQSYNTDPSKWSNFIERYDETISDSRVGFVYTDGTSCLEKSQA
jgi:hypothetical protein